MEALIALGLAMGIIAFSLAMARSGQHKADAARASGDLTRIIAEVHRLYATTDQAGYATLTAANLRAAGADLEDLWVPGSSTYRASAALVTLAPSNRIPGGTAAAGDGFSVTATSLKPEACTAVMTSLARDAVYATATNSGGTVLQVTGIPGTPTPTTVAAACNRPPAVTVALHFN